MSSPGRGGAVRTAAAPPGPSTPPTLNQCERLTGSHEPVFLPGTGPPEPEYGRAGITGP